MSFPLWKVRADVRERMSRSSGYLPTDCALASGSDRRKLHDSPMHSSSSRTITHRRRLLLRQPHPSPKPVEWSPTSSPSCITSSYVVAKDDYTAAAAVTCDDVGRTNGCVSALNACAERALPVAAARSHLRSPTSLWRNATRWLSPMTTSTRMPVSCDQPTLLRFLVIKQPQRCRDDCIDANTKTDMIPFLTFLLLPVFQLTRQSKFTVFSVYHPFIQPSN